jgi:uncharacterized protein YqgC (DUF456 family)
VSEFLVLAAQVLFLALSAAVLLLHAVGLPANWILLGLACVHALVTRMHPVGWWTLATLAGLAAAAEVLEFFVGVGYTAKRGATRWGVGGAFLGGIGGAVGCASLIPPLGSLLGAFLGAFVGAVALEYIAQQRMQVALRSGRAAFFGRVFGALIKTMFGFAMWGVLAYRILVSR